MDDETLMREDEEEESQPKQMRVSRRRFLGTVAGASAGGLALSGVLAGCSIGGDDDEASGDTTAAGQNAANREPIVIGSAYPFENAPSDAEQMERGSGLAIEEVNNAGGVAGRPIEHEIVDMNSFDPESVTTAFNELVDKEVDAVILGYHNVMEPNDILAGYGAPFLNASTSIAQVTQLKSDPERYKNIFQADPTEVPYGAGFLPFLESLISQNLLDPPQKTIHIIEGDIVYGQTIAEACQEAAPEAGWEIVGVDPVDTAGGAQPVTEWTPFLSAVKNSGAAVTFNTHWNPADHAALMKQWVQDPPDSFLYLQYGASVPEFLEIAGDAAEGAVWATVLGTMNDPVGLAFQERYRKKWNAPAGFSNAGTGYDEIYLLAHAWGVTGDPRNFEANIAELKRNIYRGVSGGYWFGNDEANYCLSYPAEIQDPSLGNPHLFFQIQRGEGGELKHTIIDPAPYVEAKYAKPSWLSF
jgi:branched-chain amino acid transport system substrate-binding protein